jgi:hypothetical protein
MGTGPMSFEIGSTFPAASARAGELRRASPVAGRILQALAAALAALLVAAGWVYLSLA